MPYPPAHCRTGGTLSVLLYVACLQPRQQWPSVCAPRYQFQSCSNCKVPHSYALPLLQTISSVFRPCSRSPRGAKATHMNNRH